MGMMNEGSRTKDQKFCFCITSVLYVWQSFFYFLFHERLSDSQYAQYNVKLVAKLLYAQTKDFIQYNFL
jgi:hypothetical protein